MRQNDYAAYNTLTHRLLAQAAQDHPGENAMISPYSVLVLLTIAAHAAVGTTRGEIAGNISSDGTYLGLLATCMNIRRALHRTGGLEEQNDVMLGQRLASYVKEDYREEAAKLFGARVSFEEDPASALGDRGKGTAPMPQTDSELPLEAILMNLVRYEGEWHNCYEDSAIVQRDFRNADGTVSQVMMMGSDEGEYIENASFIGFVKPYQDGEYAFMGLLPKKEDPVFLQHAMGLIDFVGLYRSRMEDEVDVGIPEFTSDFCMELKEFCRKLGIHRAFSDEAEFTHMLTKRLKLSDVVQQTKIEVDRKGTRAVAFTYAGMEVAAAPFFEPKKQVILNRPFAYAIVHRETGIPVFTGVMNHMEEAVPG